MLNTIRFNNLPHSKGNVCKTYFVPTETGGTTSTLELLEGTRGGASTLDLSEGFPTIVEPKLWHWHNHLKLEVKLLTSHQQEIHSVRWKNIWGFNWNIHIWNSANKSYKKKWYVSINTQFWLYNLNSARLGDVIWWNSLVWYYFNHFNVFQ